MKIFNPEIGAWRELTQHLITLPGGGPVKIISDYFAASAHPAERHLGELERWKLTEGGSLSLNANGALVHTDTNGQHRNIVHTNRVFPDGISPMAFTLTAIAGGLFDNAHDAPLKVLKTHAPKLARAAQELMLVASCRLCG
jgi:hypothetical protein